MNRCMAMCALWMFMSPGVLGATANLNGIEVNWVSRGEGNTIVFVHGWTCDMSVWEQQIAGFNDEYRLITLDLPGHGRSGSPANEKFTMTLFADAVEAVRSAAGVEQVVLVGHSMGALVIGQYALRYPGRVAAVVAVDGFLQPPPGPAPQSEPAPLTVEMREQIINSMFVPETSATLRAAILEMMLEPGNERAMAVGAAMKTFSSTSDDSFTVPALGFTAEKNFALESAMSQMPDVRTERISGAGHFLMMEKPLAFNARLREFLDEIDY